MPTMIEKLGLDKLTPRERRWLLCELEEHLWPERFLVPPQSTEHWLTNPLSPHSTADDGQDCEPIRIASAEQID